MSQFQGFKVKVELNDGKQITGTISKCSSKSLTLQDATFFGGGLSQTFKVKASKLRDLKVVGVPKDTKKWVLSNGNSVALNGSSVNDNSSRGSNSSSNVGLASISNEFLASNERPTNGHKQDSSWEHDEDLDRLKNEDFDFQGNLLMFNKQDVFAKLKEQETISPSERLVSYNRSKKAKASFEKDGMFLNVKRDKWDQAGNNRVTGDETDAIGTDSSVADELVNDGKTDSGDYFPITKSINITHLLQQTNKASGQDMLTKLQKVLSPPMTKSVNFTTLKTNITVPLATPVQLLEMERLVTDTFSFHPSLFVEHSAIHLSKFVKKKLGSFTRPQDPKINTRPLVVILASDNRCGARALAAGRCLTQNGHIQVIAMLTAETSMHASAPAALSDEMVKVQLNMFVKFGGKLVDTVLALKSILGQLNSPVGIVIDAMQGFDCNLVDLIEHTPEYGSDQVSRVKNMISWCNDQTCAVWSLDNPSGIDPGSGLPNFDSHVQPSAIISSGWPLASLGLLTCQEIYLCDIGLPQQCYALRNSLRKFQVTDDIFAEEGVVQLKR